MSNGLQDLDAPTPPVAGVTASQVLHGPPVHPLQRILLFSAEEWEGFIHEWVYFGLRPLYLHVQRHAGPGDRGIDIAGFVDSMKLQGVWDNYQCKHYSSHPLRPSDVWTELGKVLWYTHKGAYKAPRKYWLVSPRGVGTDLANLLADAAKLRSELIANWDKYCRTKITETEDIPLSGDLLKHVLAFDFSIFDAKTGLEIVEGHRASPYHAARFGGGLPPRPPANAPPASIGPSESRYVSQLLGAYADHKKSAVKDVGTLKAWPTLADHFTRQREAFYHAESLRVFARDIVPPGTFESLQKDIYDGVIDIHDREHPDGYARVCEVTEAARNLHLTENALLSSTRPKDRDGICHQLANEDRLQWTKT